MHRVRRIISHCCSAKLVRLICHRLNFSTLNPSSIYDAMLYYAVLLMATHNFVVIGEVVLRFLLSLLVDVADKCSNHADTGHHSPEVHRSERRIRHP